MCTSQSTHFLTLGNFETKKPSDLPKHEFLFTLGEQKLISSHLFFFKLLANNLCLISLIFMIFLNCEGFDSKNSSELFSDLVSIYFLVCFSVDHNCYKGKNLSELPNKNIFHANIVPKFFSEIVKFLYAKELYFILLNYYYYFFFTIIERWMK